MGSLDTYFSHIYMLLHPKRKSFQQNIAEMVENTKKNGNNQCTTIQYWFASFVFIAHCNEQLSLKHHNIQPFEGFLIFGLWHV